ncbi:MAG: DNA mismatch repair protein MutS [Bacteroidales bacterium]|nr:DNA mismatch repair protein MutS [Bacteroidales bacterium]
MFFNRKKALKNKLLNEFGKIKDDSFDFEMIKKYFNGKQSTENHQILSDKTCNDFDFDELFMFVDRTNSKVGQQYLYNKLRTIPLTNSDQTYNENLIKEFIKKNDFRLSVQTQLTKLNEFDAHYLTTLFQECFISAPKWFFIVPVLTFTSILSIIFSFFNLKFLLVLFIVLVINTLIHYWNKNNLNQYLNSLPQLLNLKGVANELFSHKIFTSINPDLLNSIKTVNKIRNRMVFFKIETKVQGEMQALFWVFFEFLKITFLLEPIMLFSALKLLQNKKAEIENMFSFVGEIDSLNSIASLRVGLDKYCIPNIQSEKLIQTKNIYHPLIIDCVENNITVHEKSILLTGSNMSGKTSFIRTIGINVITGLTLNTCFAKQFTMPRIQVFSAIRISDDLMNDKSYYFEEVLTIKEMIDVSENIIPSLFLLDELFKGTNTVERISAGKAVLSTLTQNNNIVFVSTHDIELADLLIEEYELYHFSEKIDNNTIDFDYKLKDGKLKNRNAIKILQINNYPEKIINEAFEISNLLDNASKINIPDLYEK